MMKRAIKWSMVLLAMAFAVSSCSKSEGTDDGDKKEEQQVPQSKAETESKIDGKWSVSGSGDVRSVEFVGDGTYILEVSAGSQLLPSASTVGGRSLVSRSSVQRANFVAQTGASATVSTIGTYTVSADGKFITLDDIATITITGLTADSFSFSITFTESNKTVAVSLEVAPTVGASDDRTNLLARTWGYRDWPSDLFSEEDITELTKLGLKLEDLKYTFTKSGTLVMVDAATWSTSSPEPDPSDPNPVPPLPDQYGYELYSWVATWDWKDSQQNAIVLTVLYSDGHGYTVEVIISELTTSSLKFSNWIGDAESLELVPR